MIELLLAAERLLAANRPDEAGRLFEQVAEADPRNAIAVVGLARVAVERGDEAGAIAFARRALEIDPEDAAAARLVARIEDAEATRSSAADASPEPAPASAPARRSWLRRLLDVLLRGR